MQYLSLLVASLAASAVAVPGLKRQSGDNSPCQPGDELACCASENDMTPIMGAACKLNVLGKNCGDGIYQCCNVNQDGYINVNLACVALQL
ncbi:hypothetical protein PRZ48_007046 [Zasmidium cellare]|uniref:Hydrophobin n=1 Tax=Zasmidium cellare TaxID=395010 RepID=A0ABR0EIM8_ZASCE|nr:hypothetical protein PRZ48_007046 [Zasmidium cellare]